MSGTGDNPPTETVGERPARLKQRSASRSVAVNAVSNWAAMGLDFLVRLFLIKFLYSHLGREDYGIYLVSLSVTNMTTFLRFGLGGSVLRLASEGIAARDWEELSNVLSVARTLLAVAGGLAWAVAIVLSLFMLDVLKVPEASHNEAAVLIQLTGLNAACHIFSIVYLGTLRAAQRYYLANAIVATENVVRVAMVAVIFSLGYVNLKVLGLTMAVPAVLALVAAMAVVRRLLPEVRLSVRRFTRAAFRRVASLGAWIAVAETANVVHSQVGAPLVSSTIGPAAVPMLAVPRQMVAQLMRSVGALTQPVRPVATAMAVQGRRDRLARVYRMVLRFTAILMVPGVAVLVAYGKPVIRFFTDARMAADSYPVLVVYVTLFSLHLLSLPAVSIIMGVGSVRGVALWKAAALAGGVVLGLAVALGTPWGIVGLVVALNAPMLVHTLGYMSYRIQEETGVSVPATLFRGLLPPVAIGLVPVGLGLALQWLWAAPEGGGGWLLGWLAVQMSLCTLVYFIVVWFVMLVPDEREVLLGLIPGLKRMRGKAARDRMEVPEGPPPDIEGWEQS